MSELEEWLRNHRLAECGTEEQLAVLVEIAQLLQVGKKTDADVDNIVFMCKKLTNQQVSEPIMFALELNKARFNYTGKIN